MTDDRIQRTDAEPNGVIYLSDSSICPLSSDLRLLRLAPETAAIGLFIELN